MCSHMCDMILDLVIIEEAFFVFVEILGQCILNDNCRIDSAMNVDLKSILYHIYLFTSIVLRFL